MELPIILIIVSDYFAERYTSNRSTTYHAIILKKKCQYPIRKLIYLLNT